MLELSLWMFFSPFSNYYISLLLQQKTWFPLGLVQKIDKGEVNDNFRLQQLNVYIYIYIIDLK